jgi:hypothetical protein
MPKEKDRRALDRNGQPLSRGQVDIINQIQEGFAPIYGQQPPTQYAGSDRGVVRFIRSIVPDAATGVIYGGLGAQLAPTNEQEIAFGIAAGVTAVVARRVITPVVRTIFR